MLSSLNRNPRIESTGGASQAAAPGHEVRDIPPCEDIKAYHQHLSRLVRAALKLSTSERRGLVEYSTTLSPQDRIARAFAALVTAPDSWVLAETNATVSAGERYSPLLAPVSLKARMITAALPVALLTKREASARTDAAELRRSLARFLVDGGLALKEFAPYTSPNERRPYAWILNSTTRLIERLSESATARRSLQAEVRSFVMRIAAFERFGVLFINGPERCSTDAAAWDKDEIDELSQFLEALPPWLLRGTPLLTAIVRTRDDVNGWQGSRAATGEIEITDESFRESHLGEFLPGWSNAQIILCHELGHSFHFADRYSLELSSRNTIASSGNPIADMPGFANLSEWTVIRKRPRLSRQGTYTRLADLEIPLNVPLNVIGENRVQLSHDPHSPRHSPLWSHNPDLGFTFGPNAHRSPWEDFADSFCTYFLAPADLRRLAPTKFAHFERLFGHFPELAAEGDYGAPDTISPERLHRALNIR